MSITERIYVRGHVGIRSDLGNFLLPRDPSPSGAVYIRFLCLRAPTGKGRSSRLRKAFLYEMPIGLRRKTEYRRLRHRRESSWKRSPNCSGMYDLRLKASLSCSTLVIHTESICGSLMGSRELFHAPLPIWYKLIIISFEILFQPHALASPNEATLLGFHLDFLREETVLDPCHSPLKHIHFRIRVQWHCWQSGHTRKHRIAQLSSSLQSIATKLCSLIL